MRPFGADFPFTTARARAILDSYRSDFESDDALHEEQAQIAAALSDPQWPERELTYRCFCASVLGHVPGDPE